MMFRFYIDNIHNIQVYSSFTTKKPNRITVINYAKFHYETLKKKFITHQDNCFSSSYL